ncbi:hypothetical protein LINPERHAP2_LOCUS7608 [Linum perenne]
MNRRKKKTVDATESAAADRRRIGRRRCSGRLQDRQSEADWRFRLRSGRRRLHYEGLLVFFV